MEACCSLRHIHESGAVDMATLKCTIPTGFTVDDRDTRRSDCWIDARLFVRDRLYKFVGSNLRLDEASDYNLGYVAKTAECRARKGGYNWVGQEEGGELDEYHF